MGADVVAQPEVLPARSWQAFFGGERFVAPIHPIVADTNVLLRDAKRALADGRDTALIRLAGKAAVRIFVAPHVVAEFVRTVPQFARNTRCDADALQRVFVERYVPRLHVLRPPASKSPLVAKLAQRDPTDVPTAQLIEFIWPDAVLTSDLDLSSFGYSPQPNEWLPSVFALTAVSEMDELMHAAGMGVGLAGYAVYETGKAGVKLAGKLIEKTPPLVWAVMAASAVVLMIIPSTRERAGAFVRRASKAIGEYAPVAGEQAKTVMTALQQQHTEAKRGLVLLRERIPGVLQPQRAADFVGPVLARAPEGVTALEVAHGMKFLGYQPRGEHPETYVARVLSQHPQMVQPQRGRWRLDSVNVAGLV